MKHEPMTYEAYAALPGLRASELKAGLKSMAHAKSTVDGEIPKSSKALRWGRLIHAAILEPDILFNKVAIWRDGRKAGKVYESFVSDNGGSDEWIVDADEHAALMRMSNNVHANPAAHHLVEASEHEKVLTWEDKRYGPAKVRMDGYGSRIGIVELKSTSAIEPTREFPSQFVRYGYGLQLGWYLVGLVECGLPYGLASMIAVESKPPYCVVVYSIPSHLVDKWAQEAIELATKYHTCEVVGSFPGVADSPIVFELPAWASDEAEIDMEGTDQ